MNFKNAISGLLVTALFIAQLPTAQADIYSDNGISDKVKSRIEEIVNAPSHMAGVESFKRKTKKERIKDNIDWYKKHGEVNINYNKYALDIKNYRNADDFMTGKELDRFGLHHGNVSARDYRQLMVDKVLFEKVVKKHYPELIPNTYFKFKGKKIIPTENVSMNGFKDTKSAIDSLPDGKYFIKDVTGTFGTDAILLIKKNGNLKFRHVTKGNISLNEFWNITKKTNFMLQEHVESHDTLKKLSPFALSTVRIVTTRFHDDVHILSTDLRVSCQKNAIVDNFHKNGAIIHVDTKTGKLAKYAYKRAGKPVTVHPVSKIKFENYQLPYWQESLEMVKKLHKIFPQFASIGWDVAITPTGPIIIEGNSTWDIAVPQITTGGILHEWQRLKNI